MADEIDEGYEVQESYEDTSSSDVSDDQGDTSGSQDDGRVSIQGEEQNKGQEQKQDPLKEIFEKEYREKVSGTAGTKSPFEGMDDYFAKDEVSKIKQLPLELQNTVASMLDRMTQVGQERVKALQEKATLGEEISNAAGGLEDYIKTRGYEGAGDYLEHLVSWDRELRANPFEALATVIFNMAGGKQESLKWFTGQLAEKIYDMRDRLDYAKNDPGMRRATLSAIEANKYRKEVEASRRNDEEVLNKAITDAQNEAITLFSQERDRYGRLTHPHFNAVIDKMGDLLEKGVSQDLEEVYQMAVAASPKIKKMMQRNNPSLSLTNSPAGTSHSDGKGLLTFKQAWEQALAERA